MRMITGRPRFHNGHSGRGKKSLSAALIILIWVAFAWRLHAISEQSLWRDEVDAIFFALRPLSETVAMFRQAAQNGPLYFLSLRPWFRIVGSSEFALRFPSAVAGALSIPLIFQVCRLLLVSPRARQLVVQQPYQHVKLVGNFGLTLSRDVAGNVVPLVAALFLAINPYQLWYGQEGKMYAIIVALALLSSWCWLQGINQVRNAKSRRKYWVAYVVTTSIAMYTHLLMVLIIPLHFLWFFIAWPQSRRAWKGYVLALSGLTLPYVPMVWWQWSMLVDSERRTLFTFVPLQSMLKKILFGQIRGPEHVELEYFDDPIWLAPIFFLGLAGLLLGISEIWHVPETSNPKDDDVEPDEVEPDEVEPPADHLESLNYLNRWHRFGLVVSWLVVPIGLIYLLSTRQPVFVDRYIIWIAPAAMMILALGLKAVWRNAAALSGPLTASLLLYLVLFWGFIGWQQKTTTNKYDLRGAVSYVTERRQPDELLILQIPHIEYSYRYYSSDLGTHPFDGSTERLGSWVSGLYTNRDNHLSTEEVAADTDAQMQNIVGDAKVIWAIYSESKMWDQKKFMEKWLDENGVVVESENFYHAHIRKYEFE